MRIFFTLLIASAAIAAPYDPNNDPGRPIAKTGSLPPGETAQALTVPKGFSVQVVVGEPDVIQPVAYTIDDRGRLWVLENTNYPTSPGEAKDKIVIFEDVDGDGKSDKRTVFKEGLTFGSGIAVGFGGVWVGTPPNLVFIPDRDGDDKPDGEPEIVLNGWGAQDTHETLNNFTWGPDGWLYGTQGIFTHSKVGKPGTPEAERIPINAGVWRFHPQKRVFERYAEGGSNQWGVDWDDRGQAFFAACVIPHIWQCIQGARYQRQAGTHFNPHTYDDLKTIGAFEYEKRAYCGGMVYLGDLFPKEFRNTFFFNDIHMNKMRNERMIRDGSGFRAERNMDFVVSKDPWFRGLSPQYGPDGGVYLSDWYDKVPCHQQRDQTDRSNGRIYKIVYEGIKPVPVDLAKKSDQELVDLQLHANDWYVRHARRLLQERGPNPMVHQALEKIVRDNADETRKLRALWALHVTGGLTEALGVELLGSPMEYVRAWTVQLLCETGASSPAIVQALQTLAANDASPLVRLYVASAAQRIPIAQRWGILEGLVAHEKDADDHNLPLMVWYAVEPAVAADPVRAADLLGKCQIARVQEFIARRMTTLAAQ